MNRYWITQRRCEKTLQHLPATPHERLPLLHHPDHPLTKLSRHRMYIQLHRHPSVILVRLGVYVINCGIKLNACYVADC